MFSHCDIFGILTCNLPTTGCYMEPVKHQTRRNRQNLDLSHNKPESILSRNNDSNLHNIKHIFCPEHMPFFYKTFFYAHITYILYSLCVSQTIWVLTSANTVTFHSCVGSAIPCVILLYGQWEHVDVYSLVKAVGGFKNRSKGHIQGSSSACESGGRSMGD